MEIYSLLLDYYGPRHWWPAETAFEVVIGAILTQSVAWKNVEKAIANLKSLNLMDPFRLVDAPVEVVEEAVRPTRYFTQKAERLRIFCRVMVEEHGGELERMLDGEVQELRGRLLGLKGIGPETADSIILYAAEKPIFVVDAYTRRIFSRLGYFPEDVDYQTMQEFFMSRLKPDVPLYNEYHALIDALGNRLCSNRKPGCAACPLNAICHYKPED